MIDEVFVACTGTEELDDFVQVFARTFAIPPFEERYSDHAPIGRYYRSSPMAVTLGLDIADDPDFADFQFSISLSVASRLSVSPPADLGGFADHLCRAMIAQGWAVARSPDAGKIGGRRYDYGINADGTISMITSTTKQPSSA